MSIFDKPVRQKKNSRRKKYPLAFLSFFVYQVKSQICMLLGTFQANKYVREFFFQRMVASYNYSQSCIVPSCSVRERAQYDEPDLNKGQKSRPKTPKASNFIPLGPELP